MERLNKLFSEFMNAEFEDQKNEIFQILAETALSEDLTINSKDRRVHILSQIHKIINEIQTMKAGDKKTSVFDNPKILD